MNALKTIQKTTALFCLLYAMSSHAFELKVQKGDFVQGEFTSTDKSGLDLRVDFPDGTQRLLAQNIVGSRHFMFVAESGGVVHFQATDSTDGKHSTYFQIRIEWQIPVTKQIAPPENYLSPTLQNLAQQLATANTNKRTKRIADFRKQMEKQGTPLIEPSDTPRHKRVTFLWFGARHNVILWGGPTAEHTPLQRLPHSDIWFTTFDIPDDTFLSYGFAPDVPTLPLDKTAQRRALLATLQKDPFNPHTYPPQSAVKNLDKFNLSSVLHLPNAPQSNYLQTQNVPHGTMHSYDFHSKLLNNSRRIVIYTPPHFAPKKTPYNLLFFFDGTDYLEKVPTPTILDNLQAAGKIAPTVAVFIDNPSSQTRATELPPNPTFAKMLAEELYPRVTQQLGINPSAKRTALIGSSYGGLAAAYVAIEYPHRFGNVLVMSGSFWWKPDGTPSEQNNAMAYRLANTPELPLKFFISAGYFETHGNENSILTNSRQLKDVLAAKGYDVTYREYSSGHDYFAWQIILSDGLYDLLAAQ